MFLLNVGFNSLSKVLSLYLYELLAKAENFLDKQLSYKKAYDHARLKFESYF